MTWISERKTDCTKTQYGTAILVPNPREMISPPVRSENTEQDLLLTSLHLSLGHQTSKILDRIQYMLDSKVNKITSIKIALTPAQKQQFYTKLKDVNNTNNISKHSHLPEYRVRVKDVHMEAANMHINLEVPAWDELFTNINNSLSLNPDRAVNSFHPFHKNNQAK